MIEAKMSIAYHFEKDLPDRTELSDPGELPGARAYFVINLMSIDIDLMTKYAQT